MNKLPYVIIILLLSFIFKDQIIDYVKLNTGETKNALSENIQIKIGVISSIFDSAEKMIFKSTPVNPDDVKPKPGTKCDNCKGTGKVRQGDGHVTECIICDGTGVVTKDPELGNVIEEPLILLTDEEIEERYNNIIGPKINAVCKNGDACDLKVFGESDE